MISRSRRVATPAERGHDSVPLDADENEADEPARADHDPGPDVVNHPDGGSIAISICRKCGTFAPRADGVCRGRNRALSEFDSGE
jgi:hypothetical protein